MPLIEEFATILGCSLDSTAMIALPDLDMGHFMSRLSYFVYMLYM